MNFLLVPEILRIVNCCDDIKTLNIRLGNLISCIGNINSENINSEHIMSSINKRNSELIENTLLQIEEELKKHRSNYYKFLDEKTKVYEYLYPKFVDQLICMKIQNNSFEINNILINDRNKIIMNLINMTPLQKDIYIYNVIPGIIISSNNMINMINNPITICPDVITKEMMYSELFLNDYDIYVETNIRKSIYDKYVEIENKYTYFNNNRKDLKEMELFIRTEIIPMIKLFKNSCDKLNIRNNSIKIMEIIINIQYMYINLSIVILEYFYNKYNLINHIKRIIP